MTALDTKNKILNKSPVLKNLTVGSVRLRTITIKCDLLWDCIKEGSTAGAANLVLRGHWRHAE